MWVVDCINSNGTPFESKFYNLPSLNNFLRKCKHGKNVRIIGRPRYVDF